MKFKKAFTLIELLVVIGIIGILAAVVISNLATAKAKGRDARRAADLKQMQQAMENYFENNNSGTYPSAATWNNDITPYLTTSPKDPLNSGNYTYGYSTTGTTYCIGATFELTPPTSVCTGTCTTSNTNNNCKVAGP